MKRREKLLALLLLAAGLVYLGREAVCDWLWKALDSRRAAAADRQSRVNSLEAELAKIQASQGQFKDWNARSLPSDSATAGPMYLKWLLDLTAKVRLDNAEVTPNRPDPCGDVHVRLPFTVKARTTLEHALDFLHEFHGANLLHKITHVQLEANGHAADPQLDVTFHVEALALKDAPPVAEQGRLQPSRRSIPPRGDYDLVAARNVFLRGYNGPPPPPQPKALVTTPASPTKPQIDAAAHVYLVGALQKAGQYEVWFYHRLKNETLVVHEGAEFDIAGVRGQLLAVAEKAGLFVIEKKCQRLELGQNLRQFQLVPESDAGTQR